MKMEPSTPRRSSRRNSFSSRSKNPYSRSGIEKFSALLAELEEKKQKIYSQVNNPDEISLVRFVYKDSDDCVPIVVKMKKKYKLQDKKRLQENINNKQNSPRNQDSDHQMKESDDNIKMSFCWSDFMKLSNWRRPCYYLPAAIVLILLFLVFFGRSFTILCTSIGWYIVPILKSKAAETSPSSNHSVITRPVMKKEYVRIYSHNRNLKKHGHQKSWRSN